MVTFLNHNTFLAAISTNGAELLSKSLKQSKLTFYFKQSCQQFDDVLSYNNVGN
jgi:hypothetical protein